MKLRRPWLIYLAAFLGAGALRAWMGTVRARVMSTDGRQHPSDPEKERFLYAFWHESLLAPTKIRTQVRVLISQSADGELIAKICQRLGIGTVRGSSTRNGAGGLLDIIRDASSTHLAFTPDGPRGPRRQIKAGAVFVASHTGLPIVPVGVGFTRAWRAGSWDRFALPCPGSTITGVIAAPIAIPPQLDREALEHYRRVVESAMLSATLAAERWAKLITTDPKQPIALCELVR